MIVLSAGMQKSGSTWMFNLTNDLILGQGGTDLRDRGSGHVAGSVLSGRNARIGRPSARKLAPLLALHAMGKRFVVKTHGRPTPSLRALLTVRAVTATYSFRDLRDVALSILDMAQRNRAKGMPGALSEIKTLEQAISYAGALVPAWRLWTSCPNVLVMRYEDTVGDPLGQLRRLADHLVPGMADAELHHLLDRYPARSGDSSWADGLRFNKGIPGRFRHEMSTSELQLANRLLGPSLIEMGYAVA